MIQSLLSDPIEALKSILLMLPAVLFSLSVHESAHGWVAERCGDPTARYAGRITLNPLKHIDPFGFLCMFLIGFGWAKPVPVNPLLYKNYRRDDLKVSLAGITANLCLFLICVLLLSIIFTGALASLPEYDSAAAALEDSAAPDVFVWTDSYGEKLCCYNGSEVREAYEQYALFRTMYAEALLGFASADAEELYKTASGLVYYADLDGQKTFDCYTIIDAAFGRVISVLYQMLVYCMFINLALAVFNLIPIPPLDGYHVLNDLVLKQDLFAQIRTTRIAQGVLIALILIGNYFPQYDVISIAINGVRNAVIPSMFTLARLAAQGLGVV